MVDRCFLRAIFVGMALLSCAVSSARGQQTQWCSQAIYHRMDYVIGEWEVREAGTTIATSRFSSASMGCAIVEDWASVDGHTAKGLLFYDSRTEAWRTIHVAAAGVTETWERELGLFVSPETKRRFIRHADEWEVEETSGTSIRRLVYRKALLSIPVATYRSGCNGQEYRQSDIWLGEWEEVDPRGQRIGLLSVQKAPSECVLVQTRTVIKQNTIRGTAIGFNFWDPKRGLWRAIAVTPVGVDEDEGSWADGVMRATSDTLTHGASKQINRGVITPLPDGTVHVNWQRSNDDGKTWRGSFVATYRRIK